MFTQNLKTNKLKIFLVFKETHLNTLQKYVKIPKNVQKDFNRDSEQIITFYNADKADKADKGNNANMLVSLGKKKDMTIEKLNRIISTIKSHRSSFNNNTFLYFLEEQDTNFLEDQIQGITQSHHKLDYKTKSETENKTESDKTNKSNNKSNNNKTKKKTSNKSKKKSKKNKTQEFQIFLKSKKFNPQDQKDQIILTHSIQLLRNLGDEPANILTPTEYVKRIKEVCKECGLKVKIHNSKDLKKLKMNSLLSVSDGSNHDGYLVEIKCFNSNNSEKPIVLVGKGITFDTGGISIKGSKRLYEMKGDMIGSAVVLAVMRNVALMKIKKNVIGLLAIAENMVDANATRPGDIVKSYSGKTIEVMNTDAEGRLVMADALTYGQEFKPKLILDISTLTGQQHSMSCGLFGSIMGKNEDTIKKFIVAGKKTNDKVVELPLYDEFVRNTESEIADVKNAEYKCGASTIHAGAFLSHFIDEKQDWIHIDIAGPSFINERTTGFGVRLLTEYLQN